MYGIPLTLKSGLGSEKQTMVLPGVGTKLLKSYLGTLNNKLTM